MVKNDVQIVLEAKDFNLSVQSQNKSTSILNGIHFTAPQGKVIGIVGQSGSGKSIFAMSLGGLLQDNDSFKLEGHFYYSDKNEQIDLTTESRGVLHDFRKNKVTNIFQDPYASLNTSVTCGQQIKDVLILHGQNHSKNEIKNILIQVGFTDADRVYDSYPHQLSGGECQRIVICIALASKPTLIVADEPTSSLDTAIEKDIMDALLEARSRLGATLILISHDMNLIRQYCDQIYVMSQGRFIASGKYDQLKNTLSDDIVHNLFVDFPKRIQTDQSQTEPVLQLDQVKIAYTERSGWLGKVLENKVLEDISFDLHRGEILGLVGKSGSGKSSLAKAIVRLMDVSGGRILYNGLDLADVPINSAHAIRNDIQFILQDSYLSFNPAYSVRTALIQTAQNRFGATSNYDQLIGRLFTRMKLDHELLDLFPQELSGGQRQRVLLVRALIMGPKVLICDESVMALDPYIKKSILDLLRELATTDQLAILLISHDLPSVEYVCDRVISLDRSS